MPTGRGIGEESCVSGRSDTYPFVDDATAGNAQLAVEVGVATGDAFVGNIEAVDRMIWTAIGNTTNLAARLQGLTRELDAAMVIDLATWRAAGDAASDFERREQVPIRGRSHREDVCLLPAGSRDSRAEG